MTKGVSGSTPQAGNDLQIRLNQSRGCGQALPEVDRSFMERRFGADFSGVRVHTDSNAVQLSRELKAEAFTYGRDIYFGIGRYSPSTSSGKRLLAHELMHVVQQTGGRSNGGSFYSERMVQRLDVRTTGNAPHEWAVVPDEDLRLVNQAVAVVGGNRVLGYRRCKEYFQRNCPNGTMETARQAFDAADLWKHPSLSRNLYGEGERPGSNISYTRRAYQRGLYYLAGTIVHELMHNCGQADEQTCEDALRPCGVLPRIPVGERDTGGITPVTPGPGFFIDEVRRIARGAGYSRDIIFHDVSTGDMVWCFAGGIAVNRGDARWGVAYTAQVEQLARAAARDCLRIQ